MNEVSKSTDSRAPGSTSLFSSVNPMGWLRDEIDRLLDDFGRPENSNFKFLPSFPNPVPAIELVDDGNEYRLSAELPGLTDKDVEIAIADGVLTISGEKKEETERKGDGYLVSERRYGSFKRQIALPADVHSEAIKARFSNGVLNVTLGKDKNARPRLQKIPIES